MSQFVLITRGLPGSGKSTWALQWMRQGANRARINRDVFRIEMLGAAVLEPADEKIVTALELETLSILLARGKSVIIDNTNLRNDHVEAYLRIAARFNVPVIYKDFEVSVAEAKRRQAGRERKVEDHIIQGMYDRYLRNGFPKFPVLDIGEGFYVPDMSLPKAILLDVDGTAMNISPDRGPFDWAQVLLDNPNEPVVECVKALQDAGYQTVVMSGREEQAREDTLLQLEDAGIEVAELWMRATDDKRADYIVKRELFDAHLRHRWNILFALDDRNQVVDMYRNDLQLPVFQVAYGDF